MHPRSIGIEYPGHLNLDSVLPVIVKKEGLGTAFPLIVTGTYSIRVDPAPVTFGLGMDFGVAVDLSGRGLHAPGLESLGQAQHVDRPHDAGISGLDRVELVEDRRGRTGKVVYLVHIHIKGEGNVMPQELETTIVQQVGNIILGPGEAVVHAENLVTVFQEPLTKMTTQKTGTAGDHYPFSHHLRPMQKYSKPYFFILSGLY